MAVGAPSRQQAWAWPGSREPGPCLSCFPALSSPPRTPASLDACYLLRGPLQCPIQPLCPRPSSLAPPRHRPGSRTLKYAPLEYPSHPPRLLWPHGGPSSASPSQPQWLVLSILAWHPRPAPPRHSPGEVQPPVMPQRLCKTPSSEPPRIFWKALISVLILLDCIYASQLCFPSHRTIPDTSCAPNKLFVTRFASLSRCHIPFALPPACNTTRGEGVLGAYQGQAATHNA